MTRNPIHHKRDREAWKSRQASKPRTWFAYPLALNYLEAATCRYTPTKLNSKTRKSIEDKLRLP